MIKDWVLHLYDNHSFCPEDPDKPVDYTHNVRGYISSPGTDSGHVNDARGRKAPFERFFYVSLKVT